MKNKLYGEISLQIQILQWNLHKKASLLKHYINVHSEKILTTTIEKYKKDLTKVEKRKKVKISSSPKKKNKAAIKFKNPYPRIKSANIRIWLMYPYPIFKIEKNN